MRLHCSKASFCHELASPPTKFLLCFVLFALCALFAACTTTDYFGKTYPPTQRVDVFFSPQDVRRPYEVMGEIHAQADELVSLQAMQRQLRNEAMQKGADAILIEHVGKTETGFTTVENKIKEKKKSGETSSTAISTTQIETNRVVSAKLLKYR
jgi:hypothetical protein